MRNQLVYKGWTWDDDDIVYVRKGREVSLPVSSLAIDGLEGSVECDDPTILDFQQDDPLLVYHQGRQVGLYYLVAVTRIGARTYQIQAISPVGLLAQREHMGGIYDNAPLAQVIGSICGTVPFLIKSNLTNLKISGWLEAAIPTGEESNGRSARDNLAQVLYAIGANLGTDNNGVLRVQNLWDGLSGYIDGDRTYLQGASVRSDPPYSSVTVVEHQWVQGGDTVTLFDGTATEGQRIVFSSPVYGLSATGLTIRESGANYAILEAGTGALTGTQYLHLTRDVTRPIEGTGAVRVKRLAEGTLVTLLNSAAVANRLVDYYRCRTTIAQDVILDRERPGQIVDLWDSFDRIMRRACLSDSQEQASTVVKGTAEALVGFVPPQAEDQEYYDFRVVLTGSGTWTVPEGVTAITAVLIGGGSGAQPGSAGGSAPTPPQRTRTFSGTGTNSTTTKSKGYGFNASTGQWDDSITGGDGGEPGDPGAGGKILRLDLTVTEGDQIAYACGVGGVGVLFGATGDSPGTDTTFGAYSSTGGSRDALGFTDPISGEVYAASGAAGIAGGRGASPVEETPAGVTAEGQTWSPGTHPTAEAEGWQGDRSSNYGARRYHVEASYGGGAAYGAAGPDGALTGYGKIGVNWVDAFASSTTRGATALPPAKASGIGTGGRGGNGGGGEGSIGRAYSQYILDNGSGLTAPNLYSFLRAAGGPGDGSDGGEGADGGVVIYYRLRRSQLQDGLLFEQFQRRRFVDKTGRQIIT